MAAQYARDRRHAKLQELGIQFPFWFFDVDQPAWPRKLAAVPPHSRPAQAVGWYAWPWEYGTALRKITDPVSAPAVVHDPAGPKPPDPHALHRLLDRLRYDEDVPAHAFDVVYESPDGADGLRVRSLGDWEFEPTAARYVAPPRVRRIERRWDGVPFWDRGAPGDLFRGGEPLARSGRVAYGVATRVHDDAEWMAAAGADEKDGGERVRKVGVELVDGAVPELVEGIVLPRKDRDPTQRGVIVSRGPEFAGNKQVLRGTRLETAPWSEVEEYVHSRRKGPLW